MSSPRRRFLRPAGAGLLVALAACADAPSQPRATNAALAGEASPLFHVGHGAPLTAELFAPGVISDANEQWRITFTPDGRTAYFASSAQFFPFTRQATIHESHYAFGRWSTPTVVSFSGVHSDIDPALSPDGRRLYFSSIRPVDGVARGDIDIWYVERVAGGWGEPVHLGPEVNDPATDELYPSASADGTLYFASGPFFPQPGQHFDIYAAERRGTGFAPRVALPGAVNTQPGPQDPSLQAAWDFNPEISVDGHTLVFTSLRPGGYGLGDLYVSHRRGDAWTPARNLGPAVNTAADEYHPTLTRDRRTLYFVRRQPLRGDFYRIATRGLALR